MMVENEMIERLELITFKTHSSVNGAKIQFSYKKQRSSVCFSLDGGGCGVYLDRKELRSLAELILDLADKLPAND